TPPRLRVDADARLHTEPETRADFRVIIDLHATAELVEECVTGLYERLMEVHVPMHAGTAEVTFSVLVAAATIDLLRGADDVLLEGRERGEWLECGARRVRR